jgi:hypothetical protein
MKTNWKVCILAGAMLAGLSGTAAARDHVNFSLSFGVPAPVYYAPPAPVYYAPEPAYYAPPAVYYAPAPAYYAPAWGHRHGHRHHESLHAETFGRNDWDQIQSRPGLSRRT